MTIEERLANIDAKLTALIERQTVKDYYEIEEFARIVGREPFTCREWARLDRVRAEKMLSRWHSTVMAQEMAQVKGI
jgi:hypothetical protein